MVSFGLDRLLSFSELIDKVSQSANVQLLYREMTLSICSVACILPDVQKYTVEE